MPTVSETLALSQALIRRPSITPDDAGCQTLLADRLAGIGFKIQHLRFGEVDNMWALRGRDGPLFAFAGHTDVVPTGPEDAWRCPPFAAELHDGILYGRGAADMKSSLAAMVTACERFVAACPAHAGRIALLLTSDEEGPAVNGTRRVVEWLAARGIQIDWCMIGEPSAERRVGDTIKNGRRGSLTARITVHGVQGHVAYPQRASNPIHRVLPALQALCETRWDEGNAFFQPTSFQIAGIDAGLSADNVIPGSLQLVCNWRFSTETDEASLRARTEALLSQHRLRFNADWHCSGMPFLTDAGALLQAAIAAVEQVTGAPPQVTTGGGTSDGRFIAPTGSEVVELGPVNRSIHQIDEHVDVAELDILSAIYEDLLWRLLGQR